MKNTKRNKDYTDLVADLTDLSEKDFHEAIRTAKQFRKAQRTLEQTIERQQRESLRNKSINTNQPIEGLDYELA